MTTYMYRPFLQPPARARILCLPDSAPTTVPVSGSNLLTILNLLKTMSVAIPGSQNFRQKLQALAIIHQKKALSELCRTITDGRCELR